MKSASIASTLRTRHWSIFTTGAKEYAKRSGKSATSRSRTELGVSHSRARLVEATGNVRSVGSSSSSRLRGAATVVGRIWLDVPYVEKDLAKAGGAKWDPSAKRWYAPRVEMAGLSRWVALPDIPEILPGEDRSLGHGLFVDLVPDTCWFTNVRYCVEPKDWERLRRMVTRRAGMQCEIC